MVVLLLSNDALSVDRLWWGLMRSSAESSEAESIGILSAMADGGGNLAGCPSGDFSDKFDATPGKVSQEKE